MAGFLLDDEQEARTQKLMEAIRRLTERELDPYVVYEALRRSLSEEAMREHENGSNSVAN
jgi:hypothetical protein